jgi:hypothetical protein
LLNKPSARYVLMGLHCPINLKLFFVAQLSLSSTHLFSVFCTYINPFHLLFSKCMIQTDGQAGKPDQSTLAMFVVHLESGFLVSFQKILKMSKTKNEEKYYFLHKRLKN